MPEYMNRTAFGTASRFGAVLILLLRRDHRGIASAPPDGPNDIRRPAPPPTGRGARDGGAPPPLFITRGTVDALGVLSLWSTFPPETALQKSMVRTPRNRTASVRRTPDAEESTQRRLRQLRARSDAPSPDRLFLATLRIRIPRNLWTGVFSSTHPAVRLEILSRVEASPELSVSDYWISGSPPGVWAAEIGTYPDVVHVDSLAEVGDGCLYRITYKNPPVIYLYRRLRLPLQFPLRMQAGFIEWEIVARRSAFEEIIEHARMVDPDFSIVSIRRRPLRSHLPLLTDAQHRLLNQAMAAGYFAVPRGITLTELARKLNRSKSGVSESIALIEKKLFETALRPESVLS
jgi:HTH DNA binding domain